ncbi:MBL fold metallo-hydrolase, partial [Chloroflexota bacterium]
MKEVIRDIHRLELPLPGVGLDRVNIYLVKGYNGYTLIDTGWNTEEAFNVLEKQLTEIGINFGDISQILVTHVHPDHYG